MPVSRQPSLEHPLKYERSSADLTARLDGCDDEHWIPEIRRSHIGYRIEVIAFAKALVQPPCAAINGCGKCSVADVFETFLRI